jgi:hypothetical protein
MEKITCPAHRNNSYFANTIFHIDQILNSGSALVILQIKLSKIEIQMKIEINIDVVGWCLLLC